MARLLERDPWKGGGPQCGTVFSVLFALMLAHSAVAVSYPITIPFGRSWPLAIVVDSGRDLAYIDATSGEYPPTGFLFGVINTTSHEVSKVLPLNGVPGSMALDQASGDVYVAGNKSIFVFNISNQSSGRQMQVGVPVLYLAHDGSVSQNVFVTSGNEVIALDPQTGSVAARANVGEGAGGLAIDPSSGKLFVAGYPSGEIFAFRASDLTLLGTIALPSCCANKIAVDSRSAILYATTGTNYVFMVNVETDTFVRSVQVAPFSQNSTNEVAVDNDAGRVFVSTSPGGSIAELDGSSGAVVGQLVVGNQVAGLAIDTKTHELYATNYHQVSVFAIRGAGMSPLIIALLGAVVAVASIVIYQTIRIHGVEGRHRPKAEQGR